MTKISSFIIGILLVSLIITTMSLFTSRVAVHYGVDYDNTTLATFDQMHEIHNMTENVEDELLSDAQDPSFTDVIGAYISNGITAMKLSFQSFGMFNSMSNTAMDNAQLGDATDYFKLAITAIVLVALLFAMISAYLKYAT